jgi:8-oxo-dGTP diphosphatase
MEEVMKKKNIHVVGAVIVENGKILCAQRGLSKSLPLKWEFPGGKIEEGESPQAALQREIDEEMHCKIEIREEIEHTVYEYDFGVVHLRTFYCKLVEGEPTLTEHVSIKWLEPTELESLDWAPADIPAIKKLSKVSL